MNVNYRQGDIGLFAIDKLPAKAKKLADKILARGEATGHSHRFEDESLITRYALGERLFVDVAGTTTLIHEEHRPIKIEKGIYEQINEREYDVFIESIRQVAD